MAAITTNKNYDFMMPHVLKVRDAIKGSVFVKAKRNVYLPHPSSVDIDSIVQQERYRQYLAGAEFDEFASTTKRVMLGKAKLNDMQFMPPNGMDYLEQDVDKDGLSMKGLIESCFADVLEVKWKLLLADYKGMSELDTGETEPSAQQVKDANPRPTIKQYQRESVVDWDFARVNGVMQLTYLLLKETGCETDHETGSKTIVNSYLKLGLDETGYYQQKKTDSSNGDSSYGEKNYLTVNDSPIYFIPVSIACDEELNGGELPVELGFLAPIVDLAFARYQVSAKYKEAMNAFIPSLHIAGVDQQVWDDFKEVNDRDFVASGSFTPNIWGGEAGQVTVSLLEAKGSLQQFTDYFEENKNKVRAAGGVFKTDTATQRTATEIIEEASTSTAVLLPIADSVESAVKWQVAYCSMFEGLVDKDNLADYVNDIDLTLARDFAATKLTTEEVKVLIETYNTGLLPKDEFLKVFELGGWSVSSAEELLERIDTAI